MREQTTYWLDAFAGTSWREFRDARAKLAANANANANAAAALGRFLLLSAAARTEQ
jgi:formylmethanofuran dehydrogenase subunit A